MKVLLLSSAFRALISGLRDLFAPRTHATSEKSDEEDLYYPGPLHATSEKSDEEDLHGNGSHGATSEKSDEEDLHHSSPLYATSEKSDETLALS